MVVPTFHRSRGTWALEGDNGPTALVQLKYPAMTAVNPVYARHLTETDRHCPYVYRTSGDLRHGLNGTVTVPVSRNRLSVLDGHGEQPYLSPLLSNMQPRSPYAGPCRKLVLAFDVGTTYSGVSYRYEHSALR